MTLFLYLVYKNSIFFKEVFFHFQAKFVDVSFFPTQISSLNLESDFRELMSNVAVINHETGVPPCPLFLHHFCVPFSPFCVKLYCFRKRKLLLEDLIHQFNQKHGKQKRAGKFKSSNFRYSHCVHAIYSRDGP
jgi:hypothetical protein